MVSNIFDQGELRSGQTILIHGGAGGIGSMAIQLAKAAGARVLVTASSAQKLAYCTELGADAGINYATEDVLTRVKELTEDTGVDLILDVVGAKYLAMNLKALAVGGRLVIIGLQGGRKAEADLG
ncbi:zinc-binding dehydrogenase [Arthrobacter sp. JCM 19049]|uniref:zinc-binding dehydrogenase n=1 Tax=Arthrobacter sp. JCM 19049 TaxID=1460643 RepID=UPI0006D068DC|nr:zinc-binding dehydrogenase [Arthrobacter sp. JCM 19049]